jgi:hypothetical protein
MFPFLIGVRIRNLMKKNQIEVLQHLPGEIELQSPNWRNSTELDGLLARLEAEPDVHEVTYTPASGTLRLAFEEALTKDYARIESWMNHLDPS